MTGLRFRGIQELMQGGGLTTAGGEGRVVKGEVDKGGAVRVRCDFGDGGEVDEFVTVQAKEVFGREHGFPGGKGAFYDEAAFIFKVKVGVVALGGDVADGVGSDEHLFSIQGEEY